MDWLFNLFQSPFERLYQRLVAAMDVRFTNLLKVMKMANDEIRLQLDTMIQKANETKAVVDKVSGETSKLLEDLQNRDDVPQDIKDRITALGTSLDSIRTSADEVDAKVPDNNPPA